MVEHLLPSISEALSSALSLELEDEYYCRCHLEQLE